MSQLIKTLYITRTVEFSAAHRLYQEQYNLEENQRIYGKCAYPYGHGHNYVLEVTLKGQVDPRTHMVMHFQKIKEMLDDGVSKPMDHRHLNYDVSFLENILPTSENLVLVLWDRISALLVDEVCKLHKLKLSSSTKNWVEYYGPVED